MPAVGRGGLIVFAGVSAAVLAALLPYGSHYLTNDDVAMRLLAEGGMAPDYGPTPFLLFMHVALGAVLASLYRMTDVIPWYDLLMLITTAVGAGAFVHVWVGGSGARRPVAGMILALALLTPLFATPQFSLAGMTVAAAGLALIAATTEAATREDRVRYRSIGTLLFLWGAMIRWEAAALLFVQALASILIIRVCRRGADRHAIRDLLRVSVAASAILALLAASQILVYRATPGWREFPEFNMRRAQFGEWAARRPLSSEAASALESAVGWSSNDLYLLRSWFFVDRDIFSLQTLRTATAAIAGREPPPTWNSVVSAGGSVVRVWTATWPVVAILAGVILCGRRPGARLLRLGLLLAVMSIVLFVVTAALKDVPFRLYWPMLILVAGLAAFPAAPLEAGLIRRVSLLATVLLLSWTLTLRWQEQRARHATHRAVMADVAALNGLAPRVVVVHGGALRWEHAWRPFRQSRMNVPFVAIGASAQTPPIAAALRHHGLEDLLPATCGDPNVLLVADSWILPALVTFMKEHHQRAVRFEPLLTGTTFTAWRCLPGT